MKTRYRVAAGCATFVACSLAFVLLPAPVTPQAGPAGGSKVQPRLEPVAETRLIMEGLAHSNFRGLERNLLKNPIDDQSWVFARGQALLIAETANLLMLRPPKMKGEAIWFDSAMDLRRQATQLAQILARKDVAAGKAGLQNLARSCTRCHQSFRVPVDVVPFQQPELPPGRKV